MRKNAPARVARSDKPVSAPIPASIQTGQPGQGDFVSAAEKNLWRLTERHEAAILPGVIDCPKPKLIENARVPEDQGCNSKWNSCPRHEDQNSLEAFCSGEAGGSDHSRQCRLLRRV